MWGLLNDVILGSDIFVVIETFEYKMNKTKIEWCDYTWNPIKGLCPVNCKDLEGKPYCYARRMYKRFKWNPKIRLDEKELKTPSDLTKPSRIFVCSTIELFHPEILQKWRRLIFGIMRLNPQHTFIILTKIPEKALEWIFPENVWLGISISNYYPMLLYLKVGELKDCQCNMRFISFEPLLAPVDKFIYDFLDWIIVGGLTPKPKHKKEWIDKIVKVADSKGIPIFIKDNANYLKEFPKLLGER